MSAVAKKLALAAAFLLAAPISQAYADVITYDLVDTPQGNAKVGGFYKFVEGQGFQTYSFEQNGADAKLVYDENRGIVRVYGNGYNVDTGKFEDFNVSYTDVHRDGNTLSLENMNTVGFFGDQSTNGKGFTITLGDTIRGDGWLTDPGSGDHFGDFHFAGVVSDTPGSIPAPAPLGLLAMAGLFLFYRRKARA